ncbi:carbohydrate binding domain-containing protein, partial [Spirochaetota bacterium]
SYYLEKEGAGLSAMIDKDGKNWISFDDTPGTGSAGEYRGFPNAVHQQDGSYFHPMNADTQPSTCTVISDDNSKVVIKALASNGRWECQYTFYPTYCEWMMTKVSAGYKYWVLYEGTPGGSFENTDYWMTSSISTKKPVTVNQDLDIPNPEWICFGDPSKNRVLFAANHTDDSYPDKYFPYGPITKYYTTPNIKFSIGFVESDVHSVISTQVQNIIDGVPTPTPTLVPSATPTNTPDGPTATPTNTPDEPTNTPVPTDPGGKLSGTVFGYGNPWAAGSEWDKAFDGDINTFVDLVTDGGYTGIQLGAAAQVTKIRFYPRVPNFMNRMVGGKFQGSVDGSSYTDLAVITDIPIEDWNTITISDSTAYAYLRYIGAADSYCNVNEIEFYGAAEEPTATPTEAPTDTPVPTDVPTDIPTDTPTPIEGEDVLLSGTIFGNGDAWAAGREYDKVFDGDIATFFDCMDPTGGYAGIQLGEATVVTRIRFYPRVPNFMHRMVGGKFQGSVDGASYTDLAVITDTPAADWNEITVSDSTAYTYLKYIGPTDSYCNVNEVEFYGIAGGSGPAALLTGTVYGSGDAWAPGSEYDKAFDGDTATYFDCADPSSGYTGIQLASASAVGKIHFCPRLPNFAGRMKNGRFQGSTDGSTYTDLYVVAGIPAADWNEVTVDDTTKYTYLRYLGDDGTYCNVAEIEFWSAGGEVGPTPEPTEPTSTPTPKPTNTPTPTDPPAVENLAPNPSFESDPAEHYWHSGTANFSWATDASHHGSKSLKIVSSTSQRTWWMSRQIKDMIPFTPGKEYTLKAWVKHTAGTAQLVIQGFQGSTWKGSALSSTSTGSTGWRELSVSYTPAAIINILRLDFW